MSEMVLVSGVGLDHRFGCTNRHNNKEIHLRLPKAIPLEVLEEMASLTHSEGMKLKVSVGKEETEMQIGSPGDND